MMALLAALTCVASGQESSSRLTGLQLSGNQPIQIESDRLDVREAESQATFTGNVNVVQGDTNLKSGEMTVYYSSSGGNGSPASGSSDIERIEVGGKVYVKSKNQIATGDSGTFNMKTQELVLLGSEVVLTDGDNVVVGCKLTVQMDTGAAQVVGCSKGADAGTGRVKMLLKPQQAQQ